MATPLDSKLLPKVKEIINLYGVAVTWIRMTTNAYDPATGQTTQVEDQVSAKVLPRSPFNLKMVDGVTIKLGDASSMMHWDNALTGGAPLVPQVGDQVLWPSESERWGVIAVMPVETGEQKAGFEFIVRKT